MINSLHQTRNGILRRLSPEDLDLVEPHAEVIRLPEHHVLSKPGQRITELIFPETGFVSILLEDPRRCGVEIGLIGREGAVGFVTALGLTHGVNRLIVQQDLSGHRIAAERLAEVMKEVPELSRLVARFAAAMMVQIGDTATANAQGRVVERLARWLLMARDRVDDDTLHLVHRYLADILGVRRAGVTDALHTLEGEGFIRAERGRITIRDRRGLERAARGHYGFSERSYAQIMGCAPETRH